MAFAPHCAIAAELAEAKVKQHRNNVNSTYYSANINSVNHVTGALLQMSLMGHRIQCNTSSYTNMMDGR